MNYQLIALDLDGTLLDSRKNLPEETARAIRKVCAAGKTVVFDTGRGIPELAEPFALLPEVRYAVFTSGAGLYDVREKKPFGLHCIPDELARRILDVARTKDVMLQLMTAEKEYIQASHMEHLDRYHMEVYRRSYEKTMTLVPDILAFADSCDEPFLKINLYHADPEERIRSKAQLETPELELVYAEVSSLECSATGVSKGTGLEQLCAKLGIPIEACIAVGDADNDLPMIRAAGLGVAMGNASDHVKAAADRIVSDHDHGGCAEAVLMALE